MDGVELVLAFEEAFAISIPDLVGPDLSPHFTNPCAFSQNSKSANHGCCVPISPVP